MIYHHFQSVVGNVRWVAPLLAIIISGVGQGPPAFAQTANGELEGRPAPVALRKCVGGTDAGKLCKEDAECFGSTCVDRNVFNIDVAVQYDAPAADLTSIQNMITAGSATIFDITDGFMSIRHLATIQKPLKTIQI